MIEVINLSNCNLIT